MTNEYLHVSSVGRETECRIVNKGIAQQLDAIYEYGFIKGYWLTFVNGEDDIREKLIPNDCLEMVNGRFPFLYLRLNYIDNDVHNNTISTTIADAGFVQIF